MAGLNSWICSCIFTQLLAIEVINLTPKSPVVVIENQPQTFTCSITVQQNWRSTAFYEKSMNTAVLIIVSSGSSCYLLPYNQSWYEGTCDRSKGIYTMTIKSVSGAYDKTLIKCEAIYGTGNADSDVKVEESVEISVLVAPPNGPKITQSPQGAINDSNTLVLTCEVTGGNPLANLSWQCQDSNIIQPTGSPPTNTVTSSVQLKANSLLNGRTCNCTAKHILWPEPKTQNHTFVVNFAPSNEIIITQSPQGPVYEGTTLVLTCEVTGGNPLALLSWQCTDSSVFQPTERPPSDKATSSVQLTVNSMFNGRICTCTAKHLLWNVTKSQSQTLIVYYPPPNGPRITQSPQGAINDSNTVELTCDVTSGNPLANLSWQCQDSFVIQPTKSPNTDTATSSVQLLANPLLNGRTCSCTATQLLWTEAKTQNHRFVVNFAPSNEIIITQSPQGPVYEGTTVVLKCEVIGGNPLALLSWQCTNSSVYQSTESPPSDKAASSLKLTVNSLFNGRTCTCTAKHLLWIVPKSQSQTLVVYFAPPYGPVITQSPDGPINDGNTFLLTCEVAGGNPLANLSWQCQDSSAIQTTVGTSNDNAISSVEIKANSLLNGRTCICTAKHLIWNKEKTRNHTIVVYYLPSTNLSFESSSVFFETRLATLKCSMTGGNPLAKISILCSNITVYHNWTNNTGSAVLSVSFNASRYMNNEECICIANHTLFSKEITSTRSIVVYYPPNVTVEISSNLGHETGSVNLTCRADGLPNNYTYYGWMQLYNNVIIRNSNDLAALSSTDNKTLTMKNLTFQDMGQYTCSASNIAQTIDGKPNYGLSQFSVFFKPSLLKVNSMDYIYPAGLHENITIQAVYFTMPNITNVKWLNYSSAEELTSSTTYEINMEKCKYNVSFHGKLIETDKYIYQSTLKIINFSPFQSGKYLLRVENEYETAYFQFLAVISSPPDKPLNVTGYSISDSKIELQWISGFNGGHNQTFYIVYEILGSKTKNIAQQVELPNTKIYTKTIDNLIPSTPYIFFMYSKNIVNSSEYTDPFNVTSKERIESEQLTGNKDVIGIAAGSVSAILLLVVIGAAIFLKRHIGYSKAGVKEDTGRLQLTAGMDVIKDEDELKDNVLYVSAGSLYASERQTVDSTYAAVQKQNTAKVTETSLYADVKKTSKEKKRGKTEHGKKKGRKDGEQNADVYENVDVIKDNKDSSVIKNKDGLVYAELIFNPTPNGATFAIRGIENKTIYAEVDTTLKIDPLPDSDNEESRRDGNDANFAKDE